MHAYLFSFLKSNRRLVSALFFSGGVSQAQIGFLQGLTFNFLMSIPASLTWEAPTAGKKGTFLVMKLLETLRADEINREEFTNKNQELVH